MNKLKILFLILISINILNAKYVVKLKPNSDKIKNDVTLSKYVNELKPLFKENEIKNDFKQSDYFIIDEKNVDISKLYNNPNIEYIEPIYNYKIEQSFELPNDPRLGEQWGLDAVKANTAWRKATGKDVLVAVIDTGIDYYHPEFEGQLWINTLEDINENGKYDPWLSTELRNGVTGDIDGIDNDGNGYTDDVIGYDVVDQETVNFGDYVNFDGDPFDEFSHGTVVSGVIAAKADNGIGIAGLAYDSKIMTLRAFDATGNAESDDIANAIMYAVNNGAKIINMSFGESHQSYLIRDMIKYAYSKGIVLFSSSGNNNWFRPHYPSDYPEVISVGGINPELTKYGFSNYGSMLDIVAPGQEILTTDLDGEYKTTNGTSLASPYAAAVAAMLLEKNPSLNNESIKSILQETATDAGERGWDQFYGSGIVNASVALDAFEGGIVKINSPEHEQYINKNEQNTLIVEGSALSTLINSWQIKIGEGFLPTEWVYESRRDSITALNEILDEIDISNFKDTVYTLSLVVYQKNNSTLETRRYLYFDSGDIEFEFVKAQPVYHNDKRAIIVSATTNRKSNFKIRYGVKGNDLNNEKIEIQRITEDHQLLIDDAELQGNDIEIEAIAFDNSGDTVKQMIEIFYEEKNFFTDRFKAKNYDLRRAYIHNESASIYDADNNGMIINDISTIGFGNTISYNYENGQFIPKDSLNDSWIPIGFGDSNGDGIVEFLGTASQEVILTQAGQQFGNPFDDVIYRNELGQIFWGAHFFDINMDGREDIIGYNDSSYFFFSYENGEYLKKAEADPGTLDLSGGSAVGDLDNDGNNEIFFTTSKGEIYIYEYRVNENRFVKEFEDLNRDSDFNQYVAAGDIDGNGSLEVAHLTVGNQYLFDRNTSGSESIWQLRLLRSTGVNSYEFFHREIFTGVRAGFIPSLGVSYRNGITAGDVNNDGQDEFIITAFPNLYVLTFDENQIKPFWMYDNTLSNSAIVHDFDKNGTNEIGFSTFGRMRFFEYEEDFLYRTNTIIDGYAIDENTAYLEWTSIPEAEFYEVYSIEQTNDGSYVAVSMDMTQELNTTLNDLQPETMYLFSVSAVDPVEDERLSDFSDLKTVYTFNPAEPISANLVNGNKNIEIEFSGILPDEPIDPSSFNIDFNGTKYKIITATKSGENKVILTFNISEIQGEFVLNVKSFRDFYSNPTLPKSFDLEYIPIENEKALHLTSLEILSKSLVKIRFSESITKESAENIDNYILNPYGDIILISRDDFDSAAVLMNFSTVLRNFGARGRNYTITAKNIFTPEGKKITDGPGNTLGFVLSQNNLRTAYVYPNPIKYSEDPDIYFANLTETAKVQVMSIDGYVHITLRDNDGNGGVEWNGRDKFGNRLVPGVYLFRASGKNSLGEEVEDELHKFVILP